jgi:hypothetical protein
MQQGTVAVTNVLSPDDQTIGIAIIAFLQALSPTIMISVASSIFDQRLSVNLGLTWRIHLGSTLMRYLVPG